MKSILTNGIFKNNAVFVQMIGLCPVLAVTTGVMNGIGMGIATTMVLMGASIAVSVLRKLIPTKVRIPSFIIIIATFTTLVDLLMNAYAHDLHKVLGLFIPLIVVNCIILGRAESFASKNPPHLAALDALGNGLGFTLALVILGSVRELLGAGSLAGFAVLPENFPHAIVFILPPGAYLVLGFLIAGMRLLPSKNK